jgi:hypothetical protein
MKKEFSKVLTDVSTEIFHETWATSSEKLKVGDGWKIEKRRLYGGLSDGVDIIRINNGKLSFTVIPTRGLGIWKGQYSNIPLEWSPIKRPVHPNHVNLEKKGGLGWLDAFNEMIVRCGLSFLGAPKIDTIIDNMGKKKKVLLPLHGRIANIPASFVKVRVGLEPPFNLEIEGVVNEQSFFGSNLKLTSLITTNPGSNSLKIKDVVENLRSMPDEMQVLYHCNFGSPFLEEGARLVAPIQCVAPRNLLSKEAIKKFDVFDAPSSGFVEQVFFMKLLNDEVGKTKVMVVNKGETKAVSLSFSTFELPCFTLWKNTAAFEDGYVTGLEPATSFSNSKKFERERGRIVKLKPREKFGAEITLSFHIGKTEIQKVKKEIGRIRGKIKPKVFQEPKNFFSPD